MVTVQPYVVRSWNQSFLVYLQADRQADRQTGRLERTRAYARTITYVYVSLFVCTHIYIYPCTYIHKACFPFEIHFYLRLVRETERGASVFRYRLFSLSLSLSLSRTHVCTYICTYLQTNIRTYIHRSLSRLPIPRISLRPSAR